MKVDRKTKAEKTPPAAKAVKGGRRAAPRTNGKHPLAAYEHIPIGIVEASPDGKYMDVNDEFCRILGYSRQELLQLGLKDCTHEDDYSMDSKLYEQLIAGKIPFYRLEKRFLRKEAGDIWVELTRSIVRDAKGKPLYTIGVVLDISERKDVERVLRDSAERLRLATGAAQMFMWEWDFQHQNYILADNFEQVLGFSGGLLPRNKFETIWALSPEEDIKRISEGFEKAVESQSDLHSLPYRVINPENGQIVWLEISAKIIYDREGKPERMFGVAQNITESKKIQDEIAIISRMPEENPNPVMRLTMDGKVSYTNPAGLPLVEDWKQGTERGESAIPEELQNAITDGFTSGLKTEVEIEHRGKFFSCTLAPIREAGYVNLYGKDVTQRKQAEDEITEFARHQEALYNLSDQLHRTDSVEDVFNAALDAILSALKCDRASILLFDNQDVMRFVAWRGLSDDYRKATDGHSPWKPDAIEPEPISMDDVRTADLDESLRSVILGEGIGSLAFIPLVSHGKLIGKFMIYFDTPHTFDEAELDLSLTIAHQIASGVDRKRAGEALARERELLERLFETMPVIVSMYDPETNSMRLNAEFERLLGWKSEEVTVPSLLEALYPDPAYRNDVLQRMAVAGRNEWVEVQVRTRAGRTLDSMWSNVSILNDQKLVTGIALGIDITERKQAENRNALLAEVSELLRNADDPNELMYTISKAVGEQLHVKRALFNEIDIEHDLEIVHRDYHDGLESAAGVHKVSDYSGITSAEVAVGKTVVNVDSKTDPRTAQDYEKTYALSGERSYVVVPMMRENRWVASLWVSDDTPRSWSKDEVSLLEAVAERTWTVIEKLRINAELRESEQRYRFIVENTSDGIWWVELTEPMPISLPEDEQVEWYYNHAIIRQCNLGLARMYGYNSVEEVVGLPLRIVMRPDDPLNLELARKFIRLGYRLVDSESREMARDGRELVILNNMIGIIEDDKLKGEWGTNRDITERKHAEEALRRNEKMVSTLIDAAPFGVYFIDSEFRLRAINKGSEAVFSGIQPLIGRDFAEVLRIIWHEPFATEAIERFQHTLRTGESFVSPPIIEERANIDEIQAYDWQIHRITLADGTYGVVCYFYDLSEQKRMEATVRASEALYRAIARNVPGGGVYVVDKDFRYLIAEGPVTEAFGLTREMLEGHTVSEAFPGEQGERMEARLRKNFAGEMVEYETEFNKRVYWTQQAPLHDSIGQAIILTLDITERKQAEEALRESEERFSAILRQATAGIVRKDAQGRLLFVNQALCNMLGFPESELIGKTVWEFIHPDDVAESQRSYDRLMMEGIPFKLERRFLRQDGSVIWVDASVSPIMDATGKPQSAVAVEVDITGRKQAEEALQQLNLQLEDRVLSRTAKLRAVNQALRDEIVERQKAEEAARANEEKLSTLFELLPVGISFLDLEGNIIQMNPALAHILRLSREQLSNRAHTARKYIRANGMPMSTAEFASRRALMEGKTVYNVEAGAILDDGEVIWTSVSAAPVNVADVGAVVVTVDITESKRAERALQESRERLQILSQRLVEVQEDERRAIARELHDRVGQTLAALNINLIIISGQLTEKVHEQISARLNDSMKLVAETIALVRDVMSNLRPAVLDDYGLEVALESHLTQFTSRYEIQSKFEKPAQPIPRLGASIEMTFLRIAQEALMNIARHSRATEVILSLWQEENTICLTVQDNGTGIESWQDANRPGSHGLTIMRERAEAFGGSLKVNSVPRKGTKVEVKIPVETNNPSHVQKEMPQ